MLSEEKIQRVVERIVQAAHPSKVILFDSYARGNANENSDLDLMVIEPHVADAGQEMVLLRIAIGSIGTGVDVLVYSEAEFERRSQPGRKVLMTLQYEEALRALRLADRDIAVLERIKDVPENSPLDGTSCPSSLRAAYFRS